MSAPIHMLVIVDLDLYGGRCTDGQFPLTPFPKALRYGRTTLGTSVSLHCLTAATSDGSYLLQDTRNRR